MIKSEKRQVKTLYFDYAASAPIIEKAERAMRAAESVEFGNPGSLHRVGTNAVSLLDKARETIAVATGGCFEGVIFTSSATEANNLILRGVVKKYMARAKTQNIGLPARVIISASEHASIEQTAMRLSELGAEVIRIRLKKNGQADIEELQAAINYRTVIVSLIFTHNETGAVNDIKKIAKIIRDNSANGGNIIFHTDASQAFKYEDCSFTTTESSVMTLSSHKIGGPKGVGALVFSNKSLLQFIEPQIRGGGQEFGMRSGTENVPAIAGFAAAIEEALRVRKAETKRCYAIKNMLFQSITRVLPTAKINGPKIEQGAPHIMNIWLPKIRAEEFVIAMDMEGVAISYGSACSARIFKPSKAIMALGFSEKRASESVRISIGKETKIADVKKFEHIFKKVINKLLAP